MTPEQPDRERADRVVPSAYKYSWQFDEALRKAASRLHCEHPALRRFVIAMIVVGVLFSILFLLPLIAMLFGRSLRLAWFISPLFHLLFWPIILGYMWYIRRRVDPIRHVISSRLCLGCGYSLRGLAVDEEHSGRCPECGREYNLGEYVHPRHPEKYPLEPSPEVAADRSPDR